MLTLQELSDRAEISDIVARLGYTQDDKDFDGLAALFADRIGFDMPAAGGDPATDIPATNSPAWRARSSRVSPPPSTALVTC
jgi:3-phenylpropionate/cinnamic acid dioxygenase small subunit